jgi:hypothetical protein
MESCFENVMGRAWKIKEEKKNKKKTKNYQCQTRDTMVICAVQE